MSQSIYPKARKSNLLTSTVGPETIVYDTAADKASCLDKLAAAVWNACDGESDTASILQVLRNSGYQGANEQIILMAIDQLGRAGLLEASFKIEARKRQNLSRRAMLQLLGAKAAAVLPVITTIVVPPAVHAASLRPPGARCTSTSQCASGYCCGRTGNARRGRCSNSCPPGHRIP